MFGIQVMLDIQATLGSEIWTCPDFERSIFVQFLNCLDFEWFYSDPHCKEKITRHLNSEQNCPLYRTPFEYWTILQMFMTFIPNKSVNQIPTEKF